METLKAHLKFESFAEDSIQFSYSSTSESAARALQQHIKTSEKYGELTEVHVETKMSAQAPDFKPPVTNDKIGGAFTPGEDETMSAEEVKLQQISQLYQYYNNLIMQQD